MVKEIPEWFGAYCLQALDDFRNRGRHPAGAISDSEAIELWHASPDFVKIEIVNDAAALGLVGKA